MDQTSAKQRIVVDEHDMEAWPAITRENNRPAPTENDLKAVTSSAGTGHTISMPTNMPAAAGQSNEPGLVANTVAGGAKSSSIWNTSWGSITTTAAAAATGSTSSSVWGNSTPAAPAGDAEGSKEARPGWNGGGSAGNGNGKSGEESNGMDTQPAVLQGQGERMQTESPQPTSAVPTSTSGWGQGKDPTGANNSATSANGSSWTTGSNAASSSSQLDPTSTAPWSSSNSTTTLGSSGWGSAPPKTPTSSWGDMPSTTSSTAPSTGWGAAPASSNSGWGGKPNSSQQTNSSEAAAVPGWGDSATPGSQWGRPGQTPPSVGPTGWGTLPSPSPTVGPTGAGWGGHSAAVTNDGVDSRSNRQPPTPTGWGGGDTRRNGSNSSGWGAPAGSSWESGSRSEAKFSSLESEGWGKKPINQDTQWEGVGQQVPKTVDNGTAAWGSSQSTPAAPGWGANPPPPSAWGKPRMPTEASQVVTQSVPPPAQSAWGGDRKPAWGVPPGRNDGNVGIPGAGMRGGSGMEGNMAVRGMVGNSAVGGSGGIGMSGSSAMGSGSSSQWRQPAGPMERRESTGQSRPTGWGNPLGGMPPGGNTHSQSDNSSWGTWSNEEANPPQEAPPPPRMPEKLSGWSDISDIPTTIIPTGWGGPTQQPPNKMPVDDGTFVWGNSTEHNARIAAQNRRNIARIASMLTVDAHSTMQTPPPGTPGEAADGTAVPPSPVTTSAPEGSANPAAKPEGGAATPSAWGEAGQEQKVQGWGETPKASEEAPATGWTRNGAAKPAASSGKWDEPWGGSSTTGGSTQEKDSMQTGWNEGPNGSGNVGHWGGEEDWDTKSQSSESSVSSSNWMKGRKPVRGTNGTGSIGQKESNHWISKLKRLMDQGYRQEEAEMALKKHNMNFDSALMELRQMSDGKSSDFDAHLRQVNRDMGSLMLGGDNHLSDGPKPFGMGDASLPPPSPMSNAGMMNNPMGPKPGFGNMGRGGFPPNQQRFSGMQQQQQQGFAPPFAPPSQPMRAPFNQQMMQQQQQQQQQQQFQNFLQMAVQAGLINQSLLQQPLSHQQVLQVFQNIQQQTQQLFQAQQQNVPGKMLNMRQQQELMQRLIAMQQQQMNQPTQRGMPRPPFNQRGKLHSDSEVFPNNDGGSANHADFSVKEPQQSRLSQFFAQRQSLSSTVGKPTSDLFPNAGRNDSIASISDVSSRSDGWSRSNSPTQSDSLPQSADSTFSDSGWSFPHSNSEIDLLEFKPGVPWKPRTKDVANDPHATPGSVNNDLLNSSSLTVGGTTRSSTNRNDRGSRDDISGILIKPMKPPPPNSNWSGGNSGNSKKSSWNYQDQGSAFSQPTSASNWNVPSTNQRPPRPPPGLADQPRNAGWPVSSSQNVPGGRAWDRSHSTSGAWPGSECATNWLVLRNLTPQIDGSTLRLLCLQHGPLEHFHMNLSQGTAIIAYKTRDEAFKAQRSLNTCVLSNTTIIADFATSADIARSRDRSQSQSGGSKFSAGSGNPGGSLSGISSFGIKEESRAGGSGGQWNGVGTPSLWSTNTSTTSTPWSGGETETPATGVASSLSFLPGDLLGEGTM
ncbi:trinucleotide repeat-containing gene 6C protein-like isoform X2 [Acanthaster planci]|uniref:Trinucleotide repeat-containing gene 6C protein-like isoform X2 n=1 Tax=Acanthaster planci TaxID=133434 RepID=A0A8B7YGX8_ACAPL|nr:trinucleotide repeat-containing gene 6C protein-like isoform X2 [Acanthaster planci]